jgi:putative membrane protein
MVQISLSLEKDKFTDIVADGASVNVVGRTATIAFTHMLSADKIYSVSAIAREFAMSGISFNGASIGNINLNLDTDAISDKFGGEFDGLTDGVSALLDGANKLRDGSDTFNDSLREMSSQAEQFAAAASTLYDSAGKLNSGTEQFGDGLSALAAASVKISENLSVLNAKAVAIPQPNEQLVTYARTLAVGDDPNLAALATAYLAQNEVIAQFAAGLNGINAAYQQFGASLQSGNATSLVGSYAALQSGVSARYAAIGQHDGTSSGTLAPGVTAAASAYTELNNGTATLAGAIDTLDKSVAELPDLLKEKIDELAGSILPSDGEQVSFVSDKNMVDGVLFVLRTEAIETVARTIEVAAPRKPETFIEKFLNLFGLFKPEE